jgi:hypothetical protein
MTSTNRTIELLPPASPQAAREVRRDSPRRRARTCYDHMAGVAGVDLMAALLRRGWLEEDGHKSGRVIYRLTLRGRQALQARGVDPAGVPSSRRMYAYGCLDWTERRQHLGGALAAGILQGLAGTGVVRRQAGTRVVLLLQPLEGWLDGTAPAEV